MGESLLPQCSCLRGPIKRDTRGFSTGIFGSKDHSILEPTRRLLLARDDEYEIRNIYGQMNYASWNPDH